MSREAGYGDDDRLPWLETVEEDYREGPSLGRILLLVFLLLLVIGAAAGGYYWYQQHRGLSGNGQLIEAQEGDYKIKPDEPGGHVAEGEGDTVFATSQGTAVNASINTGALPEAPVEGGVAAKAGGDDSGSKTAKMTVPTARTAEDAKPVAVAPKPAASTGSGSVIQLGAFPNESGANLMWSRLSKRFAYLAPLGKSVERGEKDGEPVFRLRVNAGSNGNARDICGKLKIAGENCYVAN